MKISIDWNTGPDVFSRIVYSGDWSSLHLTQNSLRKLIGMVPQDTCLFNETILYNVQVSYGSAELGLGTHHWISFASFYLPKSCCWLLHWQYTAFLGGSDRYFLNFCVCPSQFRRWIQHFLPKKRVQLDCKILIIFGPNEGKRSGRCIFVLCFFLWPNIPLPAIRTSPKSLKPGLY